jgi:GNAT superfamily N-acetyltransferase
MILRAEPDDAPALLKLVNSAYRGESSRKGWTTEADLFNAPRITADEMDQLFKDPLQKVFKYTADGTIQGCVALRNDRNKIYLGMLTVNPLLQATGIGKLLLKKAEDEALKEKCALIYMTVITIRKDLIGWYSRHGYTDTGRRVPFHQDDSRNNSALVEIELAVLEKNIKL